MTKPHGIPAAVAILAAVFIAAANPGQNGAAGDTASQVTAPSVDQVLARLADANRRREHLLVGYSAFRTYQAENSFTHSQAEMDVKIRFQSPATKEFVVVSESGTRIIRSRVFKPALNAEKEALRPDAKKRSAISLDNYEFSFAEEQELRSRRCYVLNLRPRRNDKFLLRGRAWIDADDYALVRVEGELVKLPSFWTRKVEYRRDYQKVGDVWLPLRDESVSQLLLFGKSSLTITYSDYQIQVRESSDSAAK